MHHATSLNLASLLEHRAQLTPDLAAMTFQGVHTTYAQLNEAAARVAGVLVELGIAPGDNVALSCPNCPWFPIAYFGILKAGAVVVPLNILLKPREVAYHLADSARRRCLRSRGRPSCRSAPRRVRPASRPGAHPAGADRRSCIDECAAPASRSAC